MSIIQGEIIRFYEGVEQTKKLSTVTVYYFLAFISGPVVTTIFSGIDFEIFGARFKFFNFPLLIVGFLWASFILIIVFFVSDLSKEIRYLPNKENVKNQINKHSQGNASTILFTNPRVNFVFLLTFVCGYFASCFNYVRIPVISTELYHIPAQYLGMIYNLECVVFCITMFLINRLKFVNSEIYFIVFVMCFQIIGLQAMSLSALFYSYRTLGICFILTFAVCLGVGWSSEQVLLVVLLGRLVPNEIQGYAAGVKRTSVNLSFILGALTTPFLNDFIFEHIFVLSVCMFVLIAISLYFREKFI